MYITSQASDLIAITQKSLNSPKEKQLKRILVYGAITIVAFILVGGNNFCFECIIICLLTSLGDHFETRWCNFLTGTGLFSTSCSLKTVSFFFFRALKMVLIALVFGLVNKIWSFERFYHLHYCTIYLSYHLFIPNKVKFNKKEIKLKNITLLNKILLEKYYKI